MNSKTTARINIDPLEVEKMLERRIKEAENIEDPRVRFQAIMFAEWSCETAVNEARRTNTPFLQCLQNITNWHEASDSIRVFIASEKNNPSASKSPPVPAHEDGGNLPEAHLHHQKPPAVAQDKDARKSPTDPESPRVTPHPEVVDGVADFSELIDAATRSANRETAKMAGWIKRAATTTANLKGKSYRECLCDVVQRYGVPGNPDYPAPPRSVSSSTNPRSHQDLLSNANPRTGNDIVGIIKTASISQDMSVSLPALRIIALAKRDASASGKSYEECLKAITATHGIPGITPIKRSL